MIHRVQGQLVRMKQKSSSNAVFKSNTVRQIAKEVNHAVKLNYPDAGKYNDDHNKIGNTMIEGGAPSNFLLMKNDR